MIKPDPSFDSNIAKIRWLIVSSFCIIVGVFIFAPSIPQDVNYHQFSDQSTVFNIPHAWNVLSNIPFVIFGLMGLASLRKHSDILKESHLYLIMFVLFTGIVLTGFGSAYYHLSPSNTSLVWDRLPMTIAFMAFFSLIIHLHIRHDLGLVLLAPLVFIGMVSVGYWSLTETQGRGDLRLYALVQFLPMLLIPIIVITFRTTRYQPRTVIWIIGWYLSAKILEFYDSEVHTILPISGHSLKHVAAACATLPMIQLLRSIQPVTHDAA